MKELFKKLLPPVILDVWRFIKNEVFKNSKPQWDRVNDGPLKGLHIFINSGNEYFAQMRNGIFDNYIYESISGLELSGETVLDIGCHIGYHSIGFSQLVGSEGKVYAIDPNSFNIERLKKIIN